MENENTKKTTTNWVSLESNVLKIGLDIDLAL